MIGKVIASILLVCFLCTEPSSSDMAERNWRWALKPNITGSSHDLADHISHMIVWLLT